MATDKFFDVVVIGGGQSGLAVGYYLRRTGLTYVILDSSSKAGGAWPRMWESLRLFSPAQWSSLPGMIMKGGPNYYPTRDETVEYLKQYEQKYGLNIHRPVSVDNVETSKALYLLHTSDGVYTARAVVSATGSFSQPFIPAISGLKTFTGQIIHSSAYNSPDQFTGQRVAVVGEGNSGAQILAEVSKITKTLWVTLKAPSFLPDHVDGRYLFDAATQMYEAKMKGKDYRPPSLGQIVVVPAVAEARSRGAFDDSRRSFASIDGDVLVWSDGSREHVDSIVFCTGFRPSLQHLKALGIVNPDGKISTNGTRATGIEGLWLVGYGNWTGFASATLIGVGRSARDTVAEIAEFVSKNLEQVAKV